MFEHSAKTLAIFSHPNHEIAVYGLLHRQHPEVTFLTDGGGGGRLEQTGRGLGLAGISKDIWYFNYTEESFYNAILAKDVAFFDLISSRLAAALLLSKPSQILCDAVEYYNPIHDIALPLALRAVKKAGTKSAVFAVPLVYQASGTPENYVFQRALPAQRHLEEKFPLRQEDVIAKRTALGAIYIALAHQMGFSQPVIEAACQAEYVVPVSSPLDPVDPGCVIRYDRRGEEFKKAGEVKEAITYKDHFLPLVRELLS